MGIKFGSGTTSSIGFYDVMKIWEAPYIGIFRRLRTPVTPVDSEAIMELLVNPFGAGSRVFINWWENSATDGFDIEGNDAQRYRWNNVAPANTLMTNFIAIDMSDTTISPDVYYNGDFVSSSTITAGTGGISWWSSVNLQGFANNLASLLIGCSPNGLSWCASDYSFYEHAVFFTHKPITADFVNTIVNKRVHPLNFKGCVFFTDFSDYPLWFNQADPARRNATTHFNSGTTLPSYIEDTSPYFGSFSKIKRTVIPHTRSFTKFARIRRIV